MEKLEHGCIVTIYVDGGKHRATIFKPEGQVASIHVECGDEKVILNRLAMIGQLAGGKNGDA